MSELSFGQQLGLGAIGAGGSLISSFVNMANQNHWNKIQMEREDNAIQRRMADLKAAGINPLLAGQIGGASAGSYSSPMIDTNTVSKGIEAAYKGQELESMKLQNRAQRAQIHSVNLDAAMKMEQLRQWRDKGLPEYSNAGKILQDLQPYLKPILDGLANRPTNPINGQPWTGLPFFDFGVASTGKMFNYATHPKELQEDMYKFGQGIEGKLKKNTFYGTPELKFENWAKEKMPWYYKGLKWADKYVPFMLLSE